MKAKRAQRPSADATRHKILETALKLFMQNGFAGTSMARLALQANVNQTLIFHHFKNKKQLWQQVKASILGKITVAPVDSTPHSLIQFLTEAIAQRTSIYNQCPSLRKLIGWQKLETAKNKQDLLGIPNSPVSPLEWLSAIRHLQKNHLIKSSLKPELIMVWLLASIDGLIDDHFALFKNRQKNQSDYKDLLTHGLAKALV